MEILGPEWLQYGALGLLGIVIVASAIILRDRFAKSDERIAKQDQWFRELVKEDRADRQAHTEAWRKVITEDIEARGEVVTALKSLNDTIDHNCRANELRHEEVMRALATKE